MKLLHSTAPPAFGPHFMGVTQPAASALSIASTGDTGDDATLKG